MVRGLPEEIHDAHLHCPRAHAYAHCVPRAEGHLPGKAGATLKRDPEKIVMVCIRVVISPQPIKARNKNDVEWQHLQYCIEICEIKHTSTSEVSSQDLPFLFDLVDGCDDADNPRACLGINWRLD